jgi:hypothetical protein
MSAWIGRSSHGKDAVKIVPPDPRIPSWKGLGADSEAKREPASVIDTVSADSLKALDLDRPIREADIVRGRRRAKEACCLYALASTGMADKRLNDEHQDRRQCEAEHRRCDWAGENAKWDLARGR